MRLVADVGGTNTRLAISVAGVLQNDTIQHFRNDDFSNLETIITGYNKQQKNPTITEMCIAVAGPVQNTIARLTNRNWQIDTAKISEIFAIPNIQLMNDLTALGYAVPYLQPDQIDPICTVKFAPNNRTALVVGIGTGCNISPVLPIAQSVHCPNVEAGHVGLSVSLAHSIEQYTVNSTLFPTVEHLFSGRGFNIFCQQILNSKTINSFDILQDYSASTDAQQAIDTYSALIGMQLREFALAYMPLGGIYCAGSIARAILRLSPKSCCSTFTASSKIIDCNAIPIHCITDDFAALYGCAKFNRLGNQPIQ